MKYRFYIATLVILMGFGWAFESESTEEFAQVENLQCTVCHDKPGSVLLTSKGVYYELMTTLQGYDRIHEVFGDCTTCHVNKPGNTDMTPAGERFKALVGDMHGLREFLKQEHPVFMQYEPLEEKEVLEPQGEPEEPDMVEDETVEDETVEDDSTEGMKSSH